jgi:6-phosphogluconolactonase
VEHQLTVLADADAVARTAASFVAERAQAAVAAHGLFRFAVSGGRTPWEMFAKLVDQDVPWDRTVIYQVDERVAPDGDDGRNLVHLLDALGDAPAEVLPMPVDEADLVQGAADYAALLPGRFDLVHLGLGPDGHTASLVPGDPVLEEHHTLVGVTRPYQGHVRMTLTYRALARADQLLWLVVGADKREPLARLRAGDQSIPAGRVEAQTSLILADPTAA